METSTYEAGFTTGEPITAIVLSAAKRSGDYKQFAGAQGHVRPGHTDLVKHYKSKGFVDVRGGGRSSFRSTVSDVIGGSIARLFLAEHFGTAIFSSICQVGALQADVSLADRIEAAIVLPDVPDYPPAQIELIASVGVRDALGVEDGDPISLQVTDGG